MKIKSNKSFLEKRIDDIFEKIIFRYDYISSGGRCGVYILGRVVKK